MKGGGFEGRTVFESGDHCGFREIAVKESGRIITVMIFYDVVVEFSDTNQDAKEIRQPLKCAFDTCTFWPILMTMNHTAFIKTAPPGLTC